MRDPTPNAQNKATRFQAKLRILPPHAAARLRSDGLVRALTRISQHLQNQLSWQRAKFPANRTRLSTSGEGLREAAGDPPVFGTAGGARARTLVTRTRFAGAGSTNGRCS